MHSAYAERTPHKSLALPREGRSLKRTAGCAGARGLRPPGSARQSLRKLGTSISDSSVRGRGSKLGAGVSDELAGMSIEDANHEVSDILMDLVRRETHTFSMRFARTLVGSLSDDIELIKNPHRYAGFINKVVARKPQGMLLAMHLCRGNFKSTHAAAGNYEPVAEALLSEMNIDAFFLEYDDERSGDFRPLRYLKPGKTVVLGLVTTKFGQLESKDALKRRIEEAAKYAPMEQLALSPQCGFSSTVHGNNIAVEDQRKKLRLVIETAQEMWGES